MDQVKRDLEGSARAAEQRARDFEEKQLGWFNRNKHVLAIGGLAVLIVVVLILIAVKTHK